MIVGICDVQSEVQINKDSNRLSEGSRCWPIAARASRHPQFIVQVIQWFGHNLVEFGEWAVKTVICINKQISAITADEHHWLAAGQIHWPHTNLIAATITSVHVIVACCENAVSTIGTCYWIPTSFDPTSNLSVCIGSNVPFIVLRQENTWRKIPKLSTVHNCRRVGSPRSITTEFW